MNPSTYGFPFFDYGESGHIKLVSQCRVTVTVDVFFEIDRCTGLHIDRRKPKISAGLFRIVEIGKTIVRNDECSNQGGSYTFNRGERFHLFIKKLSGLVNGILALRVEERQYFHRTLEISRSNELSLKLSDNRPLLFERKNDITSETVRRRGYLLPVKGDETRIHLVCLCYAEHGSGKVLYLQRIL